MTDNSRLILRDDFDGDALSPTGGLFYKDNEEQRAGSCRFGSEVRRAGRRALELAVSPLENARERGLSERAELWEMKAVRVDYGQPAWYAFSLKLDDPPPSAAHRCLVAQWKRTIHPDRIGDYSPFLAVRIIRGDFVITIDSDAVPSVPRAHGASLFSKSGAPAPAVQRAQAGQTRFLLATSGDTCGDYQGFNDIAADVRIIARGGKLPKAEPNWVDFVFKVKAGPAGDGEIEVFANGAWIASAQGRIGHAGPELGPLQYFKFGPYRDGGQPDRWRVFYGHFARGPSCRDVAGADVCDQYRAAGAGGLR